MTGRAAETRRRILEAAAEVMRTLGLAHATTKEIARAAGYSEATLYKHFSGKEELFLHVLHGGQTPPMIAMLAGLAETAGTGASPRRGRDNPRVDSGASPMVRHGTPP